MTERLLANFCERTFLKLWSYPNPHNDDGNELCDLLAVFGKYVFIFFDRERPFLKNSNTDPLVEWDRWRRNVVDRQVKSAHGVERYIRSGRPIFLDAKKTVPFPIEIDLTEAIIHKIVVAHGAKEAVLLASKENVYGSLAIIYCDKEDNPSEPFQVKIDKQNPVNIFDTQNLSIVLSELDTISDFSNYLDEKIRAISTYDSLIYCGEEDLLGHYFKNFDKKEKRHVIGTKKSVENVFIAEGIWHDFIKTNVYQNTKRENQISYLWDELIQRTCQNFIDGTLSGNSDILRGDSAIFEMVKEPRFVRRALAKRIVEAIKIFPDVPEEFTRQVTYLQSFRPNVGYVFFQLRVSEALRRTSDYLDKRRMILQIACGAAKNKFPHLTKVIGIGVDAPKFSGNQNSEDFILLTCEKWSDEERTHYKDLNKDFGFFETAGRKLQYERVTKFVPPHSTVVKSPRLNSGTGRNDLCPCGSGLKYKKCCLQAGSVKK
ncbi:MAG: SEC-C domain-containing protein [Deltaproteobacteria bacterium]|nr:SEC-C domain-containing protein [Deltaproteobacteria bacterium]